ncbi:MAG: thermonuclease family protein, partial [Bacteroidota bacterium]
DGSIIFLLTLLLPTLSLADVSVIDGDTMDIDGTIYRIHGIDAPEVGQKCASSRGSWQRGKDAALRLAELVQGRQVTCDTITQDRYERDIATCSVGTTDLGAQLVSEGFA